jgi:Xaa-Pro dipeptidase
MKVPGVESSRMPKQLAFSIAEYRGRLDRVRKACVARGLDAMILHTPENIFYLSGYQTAGYYYYQCMLVFLDEDPVILTRSIEETNARARAWCGDRSESFMDHENPIERTAALLRQRKLDRAVIGVEETSWFFSIAQHRELQSILPGCELRDCFGVVEDQRAVKSDAELAYIRQAARQAEEGMRRAIAAVHEGASENDIAAAAYVGTITTGGEYPGHPHFIASGWRTSLSHATWEGRVLEKGDPVLIELSGCVKRYSAAMMRMAHVGPPSAEHQKMSDTSIRALEQMFRQIKAGVPARVPWEAWHRAIRDGGFEGSFKRTGYSIGVSFPPDWGEGQIFNFNRAEERPLRANMVFHVPSMVKVFGVADFGNSETIRVTETGVEVLTNFDGRLFVC